MRTFVLFDAMINGYVSKTFGKCVSNWINALVTRKTGDNHV
jgi:hypothetical protein